jgi:hypothetical protein
LISDTAPLGAGGLGRVLRKGGGDEGGDHSAAALADMSGDIPLKMDAAALPRGAQHLRHCGLDAPVGVRLRGRKVDPLPAPIDDALETDFALIVRLARTLNRALMSSGMRPKCSGAMVKPKVRSTD